MIILDSLVEGAQEFDAEDRGKIYSAIIEYVYFGRDPEGLSGPVKGFFIAIKPTLDNNISRSNAGRKGGKARSKSEAKVEADYEANAKQTAKQNESKQSSKSEANTQANAKQTGKQTPSEDEDEDERVSTNVDTTPYSPPFGEIIGFLNEKAGTAFRPTSEATRKLIRARFSEGFTADDFKRVIENKTASWGRDPKMRPYLRPTTLFSASKFEGYLNESSPASVRGEFDAYRGR